MFAYIDPASGAILLQVILGSVLAIGVAFRKYLIGPITSLFRSKESTDE